MAAASGTTKSAGAATKTAPSKQFTDLGGVPVLIYTLRRFVEAPKVDEIYVALRGTEIEGFRPRLEQEHFSKPVHLVEGGQHRQKSVSNALVAINAAEDDIVLVHDAVRPFVTQEIIASVINAVLKHDAAIAGVPAVDTIKMVDRSAADALITSTVPRERAVMAQTPQGFRAGLLKKAMAEAEADGFTGTDEASLLERSGHEVAVVMGSPKNFKITTPGDWELAEYYAAKS